MKKKVKSRSVKKEVIVTRKWLMDFADVIYNPNDKSFLSLCNGTLQNGPDPKDTKRTMHCGLGELYYQLTGRQPITDRVREEDVVIAVIERSTLLQVVSAEYEALKKLVKTLKVPPTNRGLLDDRFYEFQGELNGHDIYDDSRIERFSELLNHIPDVNDNDNDSHSMSVFRARARRVAHVLRTAAKLLPA